jgi:hypothetical protein
VTGLPAGAARASHAVRAPRLTMAIAGGAIALSLLLAGCTGSDDGTNGSDGTTSDGTGTGGSSTDTDTETGDSGSDSDAAAPSDSPLMAVFPETFDAASAKAETVRVADEIQAQLDPATVLFVDDHPQAVDSATGTGQYFGVLRILSLSEGTDPVLLAKVIVSQLKAAGWTEASVDSTDGSYFVALVSNTSADEAWVLQLGGDTSAEGNAAITINLISPTFS